MRLACLMLLFLSMALLAGCDDGPRTRRPPSSTGETVDDLRTRRRQDGDVAAAPPPRPLDSPFERSEFDRPSQQERLRPDNSRQGAEAAEEAEDLRDADADRPRRPSSN